MPVRALSLSAQSAVLIDARDGRILYEKDADTPRPMASTTKIMTAIVAIDAKPNHVDFCIGISSDRDSAIAGQVLEKGIKGNFLGSDVRNLRMSDLKAIIKKMTCASNGTSEKNIASVAIVPTLRNEENEFVQGIEKLIDALKGESYTALFISEPVSQNAIEGRKKGFEQL